MAGAEHGGAEAFFERLVLALHRAGIEQQVVIRRNPGRAARLRAGGIEPVELPFGGWFDFVTGPALRRLARAWKPGLVMSWMNRATRFCRPGPYVLTARLGGYYDLKYYRHCDRLVANTKDICHWLVGQGVPAERVQYLPNFVDTAPAAPLDRGELGVPQGVPLFLCLGRLHRNKAFDVALAAVAQVPEAHLLIAGEGPERADLEARAASLGGRVRFLGWREDGAALIATADALLCPSRHEPLGNVVLEAWAQSKPVIAAASQGPSALIQDGATGLLVPVEDAPALAAAMRRLIADPASGRVLGQAGHAILQSQFSEAAVVEAYRNFFSEVTG